jgi:hypothetical protein
MAEILWATAVALAFFYSDAMLARKQEWELLVDKTLESIRNILPGNIFFYSFFPLLRLFSSSCSTITH